MSLHNPLAGFQIDAGSLAFLGSGLARPESILVDSAGLVWVSDISGVAKIWADGTVRKIRRHRPAPGGPRSIPNGIALAGNGDVLIANFGLGVLERMDGQGTTETLLDRIDGETLGGVNYVLQDPKGGMWLTVSTRATDWFAALNGPGIHDGYVVRIDPSGAARVATGNLAFANECRIDQAHEHLYVAETFGPCISRYRLLPGGELGSREIYGPADIGGFPDGIAFDSAGNLWVALLGSNRIVAITPAGDLLTILLLSDDASFSEVHDAFVGKRLTASLMMGRVDPAAPAVSSIAFGGADLCTVYLGSLMGTQVPWFRAPLPGLASPGAAEAHARLQ
jgi:sugar lactone lactonase YvrE